MSTARDYIHFTDGISIEVSGPHRIIRKKDGLYVVGHGGVTPIDTHAEGETLIRNLNAIAKTKGGAA